MTCLLWSAIIRANLLCEWGTRARFINFFFSWAHLVSLSIHWPEKHHPLQYTKHTCIIIISVHFVIKSIRMLLILGYSSCTPHDPIKRNLNMYTQFFSFWYIYNWPYRCINYLIILENTIANQVQTDLIALIASKWMNQQYTIFNSWTTFPKTLLQQR